MEALVGIEPTNKGLADLYSYRLMLLIIRGISMKS